MFANAQQRAETISSTKKNNYFCYRSLNMRPRNIALNKLFCLHFAFVTIFSHNFVIKWEYHFFVIIMMTQFIYFFSLHFMNEKHWKNFWMPTELQVEIFNFSLSLSLSALLRRILTDKNWNLHNLRLLMATLICQSFNHNIEWFSIFILIV